MTRTELLAQAGDAIAMGNLALESLDDMAADASLAEVGARIAEVLSADLRAIRLTIAAATIADGETPTSSQWVRLELFGHTVRYGIVREREVAGKRFLELTEPEIVGFVERDGQHDVVREQTVKRYHPNAVYALEEITEERVMDFLRRQAGLHRWADGSWHTEREPTSPIELDLDGASKSASPETSAGDDIPF